MADFFNQIFHPSVTFDQTINLIRQNRNFKSIYNQDNGYHDAFQSRINSLISSPTRRVHGFLLVREYLMEMPKDLLGENFKNWASFCVSYIEGSNWDGKNIALTLLDKLLLTGHNDDNTRRKLGLHVVGQIVEYICRNNYIIEKCDPSLVYKVLLTCVTKYSGSCGSKKYIINTFITKNIHSCGDGFETLTSIMANIHYCPTPGQSNVTTKNSWFDHFCAVIENMNSILNRLASWGVPFESLQITTEKLPVLLSTFEKENFIGRSKLEQSYKALALVARKILQDSSQAVSIPTSIVLQLISRASSVKLGILYVKDPCLAITILSIQMSSLQFLDQLIVTLKRAISPFSRTIYQSLMGIMENATNINEQESSSTPTISSPLQSKMCIFDLKNLCYQLLAKWFTVTGPNMYIDKDVASSLFKHFMTDMKLGEKQIELRNVKKDKSVKIADKTSSIPFMKDKLNSLNFNCLKAINSFVKNCFIFLPKEPLTFFATFVLEEVLSLYRYSISSSPLYGKSETRRELLSLIVLLCQEDETIPYGIGLHVLKKALTIDSSSQIRDFCHESFRSLNGNINPMKMLRICEATAINPFSYEDTASETVQNGFENFIVIPIIDQIEKPPDLSMEEDAVQQETSVESKTNGTFDTNEADDELEEFDSLENTDKPSEPNVIMIQEVDDDKEIVESSGDCIVYDVETDEAVRSIKMDCGDKDDDLEIVSFKPGVISIKRDSEVSFSSPIKKTKVEQEDSQSSSSRSLTIIEPTTIIHEIGGESSGELITDSDIIKDFVAD